ncbi:cupin domain-containing protein [Methylobacterium sp. J-001]|jgi:oxalate decarboxylase|uniref:cupin domain-containing protein n=1 Tax=Methylobacterium sp. J-001 TaxID=2836609 RepID=UPI001FBBE3B7|nr:cupin domain-containing protein [Methylobacterium sp. J-001]MCJ2119366.1 cupin domain-containing protein [Methylobacterium sp. J-001]
MLKAKGGHVETERRFFLGGLAFGMGAVAAGRAIGADGDGRAAGKEASSSQAFVRTIPRKPGAAQPFTGRLDGGAIKATSGGWARDLTANQLPIATGIAGAHLFLNPGGVREMHWHSSAEWAYVINGHCQVTILDPDGGLEVLNFGPGDTWSFPAGHAHAIQTLGDVPCHAILTFDDGLYGDHGTFGLSDWLSRLDHSILRAAFNLSEAVTRDLPEAEVYIAQGPVIPLDGDVARGERRLNAASSHRFALAQAQPLIECSAGTLRIAPAKAFPISTTMTGFSETLLPGALHAPHWHPSANEWHFLLEGRTRVTVFEPEKRLATADLKPGDCAYLPRAAAHMIENIGDEPCTFVGVHDSPSHQECSLSQWMTLAPRQVIASNLGLQEDDLACLPKEPIVFTRSV